ncbi:restriction endonuclease subunit S [Candidatus Methanocrinis natronophilus]|uniref:Restriction endonuclease subunit S n=1 Tax=Candidatus Methanocrinis natronophilus TaxID=3033396 RepID=A0ABT5X8I9_9EURY|nr:restriction endonuclease subunit S [Candidatus Methanocrinis natronophilus]MDF0590996.1 restriction endonuclease subunit S [Candidatus Methanocrinis natronophilus]
MFERLGEKTNWPIRSLGDGLEINKDSWIEIDNLTEYNILGVTSRGVGIAIKRMVRGFELTMRRYQVASNNQLMWCKVDTKNGAFGVTKDNHLGSLASSNMCLADINTKIFNPKFLEFLFRLPLVYEELTNASLGTTNRQYLKPQELLDNVKFHVPPIDEQRRMVARIEELAAKIEEAQDLRRQAAEEAEALFAAATRFIFNFKLSSMATIEEIVGKKNLKNGLSIRTIGDDSQIKCLRLSGLRDGKIDCSDSKPIPITDIEAKPYLIKDYDVFIVRGNGSKSLVGRAGMVVGAIPGTIFPDLFIRVPLDKNQILPEFFVAWWNSQKMRDLIEETAKTTSGIWKINQGHIASFSIPILPLTEQRRIVAHLDGLQAHVDGLKRCQARTAEELDALLPAVLERAFRGELGSRAAGSILTIL